MKTATTVESLLKSLPPQRAREMSRVRAALKKYLPEGYEEAVVKDVIAWQVPLARYPDTYNKQPLWLAALGAPKSYLTLHFMPVYFSKPTLEKLQAAFKQAGKKLDIGMACIHYHTADDLALDALGEIIAGLSVDKWVGIAQTAQAARKKQ